ncbi:putative baseplate assembly protein [Allostreptomyces psammosilenae]|uniref:Putative phage baseplate assembly protein n=1 Tax=Allostreptomyces psammosilenae TaxID=1892865 RepID=A0A853A0H8_9ACTN|nr:putative baseplate assembly protein [Allostreptomyces psammosilenae]NYI03898.1 putative phage baseplate assembly protein [Allostreptomyces psammosilenae]
MTLPSPNLDDRRFQALVDDAKRLVQQRCPEWTDHNVSDPGVTLIEAFATMVDQLVYRLNRVPEKNYLTFLDLIGVRLYPPTAARAEVTFWLSAPQPEAVRVRAGTEAATVRTEAEEAVVFSTTRELTIPPCHLAHLATRAVDAEAVDRSDELALRRDVPCFGATPTPGDALYVGLSGPVPAGVVVLRLDCAVHGVGVDPRRPPLLWEAWDGTAWTPCEVERDDTGGFNRAGEVILHLPRTHAASVVARRTAGWVRCRLLAAAPGQPTYVAPPTVREITAFTIGATVDAVHAETVTEEILGLSEGVPGQGFRVARPPVVPGDEPFVVEVGEGAGWAEWVRVDDFAHSGPADRHVTLDPNSGEVRFGPAVREPDGTVRHYGAVPPKGGPVRVRAYRTGGGRRGNVARGALRVLRSSLPYVARVENRRAALGGVDGETVEAAMVRGPMTLRTLHRAVVPHDYEQLARQAAPGTARVRCVPAGDDASDGGVRLLVVPSVRGDELGRIRFQDLTPPPETMAAITDHLDERRPIGTRLVVEPPFYRGVTVVASVQARRGANAERLRQEALAALYGYFNPLTGGPEGAGWPFGRPVHAGEVYAVLQRVHDVDLVEDVRLFPADPVTGERTEPTSRIPLDRHALIFSYEHQLRVREA